MIQTEMSADTRAIADLLIGAAVGETITFGVISAALGRDATACRHVIGAARRVAQREAGAVFISVARIGYRRLPAEEVARVIGSNARQHIRRTAGRARKTLIAGTSAANDLTPEMQRRVSAEVSTFALIEHISRDAVVKPAEDGPTKPTPVAVTARSLLSRLGVAFEGSAPSNA